MCSPLVPNMTAVFLAFSELQGISQFQELIDLELLKLGGFPAADMGGYLWAPAVTVPVLMWQVRKDVWTKSEDGQKTFELLASKDKELVWIEDTTRRFKDGYNWFGRNPEKVLQFLGIYMK